MTEIHLYHFNHNRPQDLARVTMGLSWCGSQVFHEKLTNALETVTCAPCLGLWNAWKSSQKEGQPMTSSETTAAVAEAPTTTQTGPEIVAEYNALAAQHGKPTVKKFKNLEVARRRLEEMKTYHENPGNAGGTGAADVAETAPKKKKVAAKKTTPKAKKKRGFSDDAVITVLEPDAFADKKRETEAMKRFKKMVKSKAHTVGDYLKIGTIGDLKWWITGKKIKVGAS